MKKYVKPALYFESFELSQNITVCGFDMNTTESLHCQAIGDADLFLGGMNLLREWCDISIDSDFGSLVCYQNGVDDGDFMRIFNS